MNKPKMNSFLGIALAISMTSYPDSGFGWEQCKKAGGDLLGLFFGTKVIVSSEEMDRLAKAAESAAQNAQKIAQANDQLSKVASGVGDISKKVGAVAEGMENVSKVATTFQYIASIAALVHITYNLGSFYKSGRDYFWPTEEQILKQQEVSRKLKIIQAEVPLNECLEDHKRGPIDSDGIPCACQDFLQAFGRAAGPKEVHDLKKIFAYRASRSTK
jgi:hypothetical protein